MALHQMMAGTDSRGAEEGPRGRDAPAPCFLLNLPTELHHLILQELPLSARFLYQTQICTTLRRLFCGAGLLSAASSHRFDLVDWTLGKDEVKALLDRQEGERVEWERKERQEQCKGQAGGADNLARKLDDKAANKGDVEDKRSIWDVSPSTTPRPAPSKSTTTAAGSSIHVSHLSSLLYDPHKGGSPDLSELGGAFSQRSAAAAAAAAASPSSSERSLEKLIYGDHPEVAFFVRCLTVMGAQKRQHQRNPLSPLSNGVKNLTVLSLLSRTGMKVASLIQMLETNRMLYDVETILMTSASFIDAVLWTVFTPPRVKQSRSGSLQTRQSIHFDMQFSHSTCIDTQAIVIPGPLSAKGQGLRSGFKCLCFSNYDHHQHHHPPQAIEEGKEDMLGDVQLDFPAFHVIFHDWYNEEEAISTQDMLEHSDISCNTCKRTIVF